MMGCHWWCIFLGQGRLSDVLENCSKKLKTEYFLQEEVYVSNSKYGKYSKYFYCMLILSRLDRPIGITRFVIFLRLRTRPRWFNLSRKASWFGKEYSACIVGRKVIFFTWDFWVAIGLNMTNWNYFIFRKCFGVIILWMSASQL